jgi:hypothetical protein
MFRAQLISLIFLLAVCCGCHMTGAPLSQANVQSGNQGKTAPARASQAIPTDTEIILERQECDLTCPIYKLTISADGKVVYEGRRFVKRTGIVRSSIGTEKLAELISEIERINYFSLKDKYSPGNDCPQAATDYPTAITSVRLNGKSKTIEHYYGCSGGGDVFEKLTSLESKIDEAVNAQQWIK